MFSKLMKRSNAVWLYSTGRFAEERRTFFATWRNAAVVVGTCSDRPTDCC